LNKGLILISSTITLIFFILCIANISAPPAINLLSEILLMARIISFDFFMVLVFPLGSFLGAVFTFYIFSYTQHGKIFLTRSGSFNCSIKELNTLLIHIIPLNYLILVPEIFLLM
jgi:NADH-ubiquinone oxidoreductase chain 4